MGLVRSNACQTSLQDLLNKWLHARLLKLFQGYTEASSELNTSYQLLGCFVRSYDINDADCHMRSTMG